MSQLYPQGLMKIQGACIFNASSVTLTYATGLFQSVYNGYFSDNVNFFLTAPLTSFTNSTGTTSSTAVVNSLNILLPQTSAYTQRVSYQILGYFKPPTTNTYTFTMSSDDASYLWIGTPAIIGRFNTTNAIISLSGIHVASSSKGKGSGTIYLSANNYYPFRLQYGNNLNQGSLYLTVSSTTTPNTNNLGGYVYYNVNSASGGL
jgi:hypothetical protein